MRRTAQLFLDNSGLLISGTLLALVWANIDGPRYQHFAHLLHFAVNDVAMAFFFALAAKEVVEATAPGGALHTVRRSGLPLAAAAGGMLGPALIYLWLIAVFDRPDLQPGWAIPCATDIAFSYLAARLIFGARHQAVPFLVLLAIADDAIGLVIIGMFYPSGAFRPLDCFALLGLAIGLAWWLHRRKTLSIWPYLGAGAISWLGLFRGGLHPALALVPIMPFLPHAARDRGLFVEDLKAHDTLNAFEHQWRLPVQIILFFFGLVNGGVPFSSTGAGTWAVLAAIIFGKPVGIMAAAAAAVALGLHRPAGVSWTDLLVVSMTAAIGFTVALFFATAAFPPGHLLDETKMGALLSISAAALSFGAAAALRTGRFQRTLRQRNP